MKKIFLGLLAGTLIPACAFARDIPNAVYFPKDKGDVVIEKGIADGQKQYAQPGTKLNGLIDVDVFRIQVPLNKIDKSKDIINKAIKKASEQSVVVNPAYTTEQQSKSDVDVGNGFRAGFFTGAVGEHFKTENILKSDTAFINLPASVDSADRQGVLITPATAKYLSGFSFKIKTDSSKDDKSKSVSYNIETKTKANAKSADWTTNSYEFTLKPREQHFFYSLPKGDSKSKETVDVYVFAVYPFVRTAYYNK